MEQCSICLEIIPNNPNITICNHKFHRNCLNQWLNHNNTCPMWRPHYSIIHLKLILWTTRFKYK